MNRKKILLSVFLILAFAATSQAFDTQGKFGMGLRMWGTPVIAFSTLKYGVNNLVTVEPSLGYYRATREFEETVYDYSTPYPYQTDTVISKYTDDFLNVSLLFDLKPLRYEKSNLCVKTGLLSTFLSSHSKYGGNAPSFYDQTWGIALLLGLGVEHFFTNWFSVNAGFLSGFGVFESGKKRKDTTTIDIFGNQLADFSLVWYLK